MMVGVGSQTHKLPYRIAYIVYKVIDGEMEAVEQQDDLMTRWWSVWIRLFFVCCRARISRQSAVFLDIYTNLLQTCGQQWAA